VEELFWRRLWITLCGGTIFIGGSGSRYVEDPFRKEALDRAMWRNRFGEGSGSRYVEEPFWRRLWITLCGGTVLEEALDLSLDRIL
jgi:hypothetical protein